MRVIRGTKSIVQRSALPHTINRRTKWARDLYLQLAVLQALVGQQFLEESASQLTYHGLCELNAKMGNGELAVFFRNNHFSTIYKQVRHWILYLFSA
jgi:hypothetical protein